MQNKEKAYETEKTFQSDRNNRTEFIHEFENNYEAVIEEIQNKRRFGNLAGVDITRVMLDILGRPEEGMRYIHIAGTNGKGSVSAFLCSILREAGLKVGMFTSPHLVDFRERIQINGEMISKEDVLRLGKSLLEQDFGVHPTMFDYCLCMAVAYFKEQKCDVAVIETGLGGRLDSTNALGTPKVGIITKLGFDHTAILGNTIEEIAKEKAGIIKSGMKLVCESQEKAAEEILQNVAAQNGISEVTIINENDRESSSIERLNKILNYAMVCMQIAYPYIYNQLTETPDFKSWNEKIASKLKLRQLTDAESEALNSTYEFDEEWEKVVFRMCQKETYLSNRVFSVSTLLNKIAELINDDQNLGDIIASILELSAVTNLKAFDGPMKLPKERKRAVVGDYTIIINDDNSVAVHKNGNVCANSKAALREVASLIGIEVEDKWTTRQLGSKVVKAINMK